MHEKLSISKIKMLFISTIKTSLFHYFGMTLPIYFCCICSSLSMNVHSQFIFAFSLAHLSEHSLYMSFYQFLNGTLDRYM
jgi:hypothetical protein